MKLNILNFDKVYGLLELLPEPFYFFFYMINFGQFLILPFYFIHYFILDHDNIISTNFFIFIFLCGSTLAIISLIVERLLYRLKIISVYRSRFFSKSERFTVLFVKSITIISYLTILIFYLLNYNNDYVYFIELFVVLVFWYGMSTIVINLFNKKSYKLF
jgi:hypothetical protein